MAAHVQQWVKKTLISPSGSCSCCTASCSGCGNRAAMYRCGLGRAGVPHAGTLVLLRSQIKLLPMWISWWVSKAFARRAAGTAAAPWLQHSRRDTNWVSLVVAFCRTFWVTESEEIYMVCCFTEWFHIWPGKFFKNSPKHPTHLCMEWKCNKKQTRKELCTSLTLFVQSSDLMVHTQFLCNTTKDLFLLGLAIPK